MQGLFDISSFCLFQWSVSNHRLCLGRVQPVRGACYWNWLTSWQQTTKMYLQSIQMRYMSAIMQTQKNIASSCNECQFQGHFYQMFLPDHPCTIKAKVFRFSALTDMFPTQNCDHIRHFVLGEPKLCTNFVSVHPEVEIFWSGSD